jgi:hypothetical protein
MRQARCLGAVVFSTATLIASTLVLIDGSGTSAKNASG